MMEQPLYPPQQADQPRPAAQPDGTQHAYDDPRQAGSGASAPSYGQPPYQTNGQQPYQPYGQPPYQPCGQPYAPPAKKPGRWRQIGTGLMYLGIYLGVQSVVSTLYVLALCLLLILRTGQLDMSYLLSAVNERATLLSGISDILTLLVFWIIFSARKCRFDAETGLRRVHIPSLLIVIPLGLCAYVVISGLLSLLPESLLSGYSESSSSLLTANGLLPALCLVVIAPFAEEVLFRGLIYTRFKRAIGLVPAMLVASLIFGLLHGQLIWAAYAFVLGLLLTGVFEWFGSLWAGILLHACFNAGQYVFVFLDDVPILPALILAVLLFIPLILITRRLGLAARR